MKKLALLMVIFLGACTNQPKEPHIKISLTDSNLSIKIVGFEKALIAEINRDTAKNTWQSFLPVYKMPADTELRDEQKAQPGNYKVNDSMITFTPDTSFKKGQIYFLRYYLYAEGSSIWQSVKSKKRPGALAYKDLSFSY